MNQPRLAGHLDSLPRQFVERNPALLDHGDPRRRPFLSRLRGEGSFYVPYPSVPSGVIYPAQRKLTKRQSSTTCNATNTASRP